MNKREERERQRRLDQQAIIRRQNVAAFWLRFSACFRPWLWELTRRYKERLVMPPFACWILPSYYTDREDCELAAMAAMLIKDDANVQAHCRSFRVAMGEHPFAWFRDRCFVPMGFANVRNRLIGGIRGYRVSDALSALWESRRRNGAWEPEEMGVRADRVRMARMSVPSLDDGSALCPLSADVVDTLKTFFPDYKRLCSPDDAIRLFGFERDSDFFFAALAWKELKRRNPVESSRLATLYHKRYKDNNLLHPKYWNVGQRDGILPKIDF